MARSYGRNNNNINHQVQQTKNNQWTLKRYVVGFGVIAFAILCVGCLILSNNISKKQQEEELARVQHEFDQGAADAEASFNEFMDIDDQPVTDTPESSTSSENEIVSNDVLDENIKYAFDMNIESMPIRYILALKEQQDEAMKVYEYLKSEGYDMPDWGCVLTDTFDVDAAGNVINYHTKNEFHAGVIGQVPYTMPGTGNKTAYRDGVVDITNVSSGWFYNLDESTEAVLSRLFGKTEDEDYFHLRARLIDEKSFMYSDICDYLVEAGYSENEYQTYYNPDFQMIFWFDADPEQFSLHNQNGFFSHVYGKDSDSEMFKNMCKLVDEYDNYRLVYFRECISVMHDYVDKQAGYGDDVL